MYEERERRRPCMRREAETMYEERERRRPCMRRERRRPCVRRERRRPCMRRERGGHHAHLLGSLVLFCPTGSSRLQLLWGRLHPPLSPAHAHNHTLQLVLLTPPTYSSLLTTHTHTPHHPHTHIPHSSPPTHTLLTPHPHTYSSLLTTHTHSSLLTTHTHSSLLTTHTHTPHSSLTFAFKFLAMSAVICLSPAAGTRMSHSAVSRFSSVAVAPGKPIMVPLV